MRRRGFTLTELLIVMVIIGILLAFVLTAATAGLRNAEAKATEALISKLDTALADRLEAVLQQRVEPVLAHFDLAQINGTVNTGAQRAQVIAQFDLVKSEIPDVFLYDSSNGNYPLNFAWPVFPNGITSPTDKNFGVPLGAGLFGTGMYGASFTAAGGFYKQLGYGVKGYDGSDSDADGMIDDLSESGLTLAQVQAKLNLHTHKTARSEALYALLVEGQGPYGSAFNRDDFTDKEVADTDGDGLMEFIDAWGEPLQFYRWPIAYHSDLQKGMVPGEFASPPTGPYTGAIETRELNPLDQNQQLTAPGWWSSSFNSGGIDGFTKSAPLSAGAVAFQTYFTMLVEPGAGNQSTTPTSGTYWDRGSTFWQRRAYYSKFLIISSGLDRQLGVARLDTFPPSAGMTPATALLEGQARQYDLSGTSPYWTPAGITATYASGDTFADAAVDDISNHALQAMGSPSR